MDATVTMDVDIIVTGVDPETHAAIERTVDPLRRKVARGAYHTRRRVRKADARTRRAYMREVAAAPKVSETVLVPCDGYAASTLRAFGCVASIAYTSAASVGASVGVSFSAGIAAGLVPQE